MNSTSPLTGSHLRTYQTLFQHPISHNLGWRDIRSLLEKLGEVSEEPNGNLKVTRHGQSLVLHPPRTKDVDSDEELMALRHFLKRSDAAAPATAADAPWLVVLDHQAARIYRSTAIGAVPQFIRPHPPEEFFRQAPKAQDFARGQEKPDPNSFFEPVAGVLAAAPRILLFGSGTGTSSAMDQFAAWLQRRRPELAARIIGSVVVDEHHLTEDQLLALARDYTPTAALIAP